MVANGAEARAQASPTLGPAQRSSARTAGFLRRDGCAHQGRVLLGREPVVRPAARPRPLDLVDRRAELGAIPVDEHAG
jgi:hypothetical protein